MKKSIFILTLCTVCIGVTSVSANAQTNSNLKDFRQEGQTILTAGEKAKLALQPSMEEIQVWAKGHHIDSTWMLSLNSIVVCELKDTLRGKAVSVYKDGFSIAPTIGASYLPRDGFSPTLGVSFSSHGLISWQKVIGKEMKPLGYRVGDSNVLLKDGIIAKAEPCYYKWQDGKLLISKTPEKGFEKGEVLMEEVDKTKRVAPFGAELNVSALLRQYEDYKYAVQPNKLYPSYKTTLYLKWRLVEDKWQKHRLCIVGTAGYLFARDKAKVTAQEVKEEYTFSSSFTALYTGSGLTYGGGLEYRYQFPLRIKEDGKANGTADDGLIVRLTCEALPFVQVNHNYHLPSVNLTVAYTFGINRWIVR